MIGLPEAQITDVRLNHVTIMAAKGMQVVNTKGLVFSESSIAVKSGAAMMVVKSEVSGIDPETGKASK